MPSSYTLGDHYEKFVKALVESGRYNSASEVLRDGLRLMEEREQLQQLRLDRLRAEIAKGTEGPFRPLDMNEIIAKAKRRKRTRDAA